MKYLILGSSGQIGTGLCTYLKNHEIYTYDIADSKSEDLRKGMNDPVLVDYVTNCDFVFFLAFDVGGSRYLKKYQHTYEFIDNNVKIMQQTFELLRIHKKPFIFCSSQMSNMGYSSYGVLKSLGEYYTKILNGLVVKFWNVYGVENDLDKSHVITDFVLKAMETNKIKMLTDGKEERQFLYERDCNECLKILADNYDSIDREKSLHITSFKWNCIIDIANIINDYLGGNIEIVPSNVKDDVQQGKRNEPDEYIKTLWMPKTSLRDGILDIINHYKE